MKKIYVLSLAIFSLNFSTCFAKDLTFRCFNVDPAAKSDYVLTLSQWNNPLVASLVENTKTTSYTLAQNLTVEKKYQADIDSTVFRSLYFNLASPGRGQSKNLEGYLFDRKKVAKLVYCQLAQ